MLTLADFYSFLLVNEPFFLHFVLINEAVDAHTPVAVGAFAGPVTHLLNIINSL